MTKKFKKKKFSGKHIIKMNTKTIRELRSNAKDMVLLGFYKLNKTDLLALSLEQLSEKCQHHHRGVTVRKKDVHFL